jgi:hypothetical protein
MTLDDLLDLAVKSGAGCYTPPPTRSVRGVTMTFLQLQSFAYLITEAVVAQEREACASLVEREWSTTQEKALCDELAAYIRARGEA